MLFRMLIGPDSETVIAEVASGRSPGNPAQAFDCIEVFVAADDWQSVFLGQGSDPAIVGRNRGAVILKLASDFRVMRQCFATNLQKLGVREKSLEPVRQLALMA